MSIRSHRDFLRIWAGQVVSNIGDGVHRIAVLWWAKQATGSNAVVVLVALATTLPLIAAAPLAGWLVDHWPRRRLMVLADAARVVTSGVLAVLAVGGDLSTSVVVACALVASAASAVFNPAYMASITLLVPADDRPRANSLVGLNDALSGIAGPALGGVLIGLWGTASALWFDAATFAVSLALVLASRVPDALTRRRADDDVDENGDEALDQNVDEGVDDGLFAGVRLVREDRSLRDLVVVAMGLNLFVAPVPILIVALAAGPFGLDGVGYGLLEACIPLGMVIGFVVGPRVVPIRPAALVSLIVTSVAIGLAGATTVALVGGLTFVAAGVGIGIANTILPTRFQQDVDPALQGRVFALLGALMQAGRPVGLVLTAPLLAVAGPRAGLAVCGACTLAVSWVGRSGMLGPVEPEIAREEIDVVPA
jgi:MFS transporter, DHA3 family, macrolide efflux protein